MSEKTLDEKKILLIISCKNKEELQSQLKLLKESSLSFPEGCALEVYPIVGSKNLAASFNEAQRYSNAKYKIYLTTPIAHIHEMTIFRMYNSFYLQPNTHMVGLLGSELPISGDYTEAKSFFGRYDYLDGGGNPQTYSGKDPLHCQNVHLLDKGFFATDIDLTWDEKIGEEFFMAAQCCRFRSEGYGVCVTWQPETWIIFARDECSYNYKENQKIYTKQLEKFKSLYHEKRTPLVSILIPTYNQPKFFQEALESALAQTYPHIEIVVGDDSTNEETKKLIQPYLKKHKNIKYFFHGKPLGRKGAMNMRFVLNNCSGEFVNFLLHDDLFYPEKIYKMMDYYIRDLEESICLVTSARDRIDQNSKFIRLQSPWYPRQDTVFSGEEVGRKLLFVIGNFLGELSTNLIRKKDLLVKFFNGTQLFSNSIFCDVRDVSYGDLSTWLNILKSGRDCVFIAERLSAFRWHPAQNTHNPITRIWLPMDALNFMTLAWLNNIFFRNLDEYKFCYRKWPIFLNNYFDGFQENDSEYAIKIKTWAIKLKEAVESGDHEKFFDCAIDYLLERLPYGDISPVARLVRKNEDTGHWEKIDDGIPLHIWQR